MSTRKLIVTALLCGLAILVAGGVLLLRLASDPTTIDILTLGQAAHVGPVSATAVGSRERSGQFQVEVTLAMVGDAAPGAAPADAASGWTLLAGGEARQQLAPDALDTGELACIGHEVGRATVDCWLAFAKPSTTAYLSYGAPSAGAQWRV